MKQHTCPNCGTSFASTVNARTVRPVVDVDPALLSGPALFAHYKRTAPLEDIRAFLDRQTALSPALRIRAEALRDQLSYGSQTAATKAEYSLILCAWRWERLDADIIGWNLRKAEEEAAEVLAAEQMERDLVGTVDTTPIAA